MKTAQPEKTGWLEWVKVALLIGACLALGMYLFS